MSEPTWICQPQCNTKISRNHYGEVFCVNINKHLLRLLLFVCVNSARHAFYIAFNNQESNIKSISTMDEVETADI